MLMPSESAVALDAMCEQFIAEKKPAYNSNKSISDEVLADESPKKKSRKKSEVADE
jgi:hypothetical protein